MTPTTSSLVILFVPKLFFGVHSKSCRLTYPNLGGFEFLARTILRESQDPDAFELRSSASSCLHLQPACYATGCSLFQRRNTAQPRMIAPECFLLSPLTYIQAQLVRSLRARGDWR